MQFQRLIDTIKVLKRPATDVEVTAPISEDSRTVQPGGVFVARKGPSTDSHDLIADAIGRGAVAVVGERPPENIQCEVPYAQVADTQSVIGLLAAAFYGHPSRDLVVIGVTGTDGKTTTTNLIFNILQAAHVNVGMISTVSAIIGDVELPTGLHVTTPSAPEVQMYLRRMVEAGLTHCVLETTSHGLAQGRVNGVDYDVAVITNITHEHLDFHGSFENYRAAKALLFKALGKSYRKTSIPKVAVVNLDDENAPTFLAFAADYHITYGLNPDAILTAGVSYGPTGTHLAIRYVGRDTPGTLALIRQTPLEVHSPLVGAYNVQNILAASAATLALNCPIEAVRIGIESMPPVPGRMERIDEGQDFTAIVDFAHTPNALQSALQAARLMIESDKRIICVFGSAGLRDRQKRRLMAEIGAQLADICVLTAEDPRTESLAGILHTMADGVIRKGGVEGKTFYRVPDRGEALAFACKLAHPGDLVLVCGKGHEQSMAFGSIEYPWDDRTALRAALHGNPDRSLPTAQPDFVDVPQPDPDPATSQPAPQAHAATSSASALEPLHGRVALVTGVSRRIGIGYAIASRLAQRGADLFIQSWSQFDASQPWGADPNGIDSMVADLRAYGHRVEQLAADFSKTNAPAQVMKAAVAAFGHIDILVANHAYSTAGSLENLTAENIDMHLAVNVRATLLLVKAWAAQHDGRPGGRLILMTSGQHSGPMPGELSYVASKAALHGLTQSLSATLIRRGITVNTVNPGPTDTGWASPELYQQVLAQSPQGRWGQPDDAARLIAWLVSEDAQWVTGQVINSTGGF